MIEDEPRTVSPKEYQQMTGRFKDCQEKVEMINRAIDCATRNKEQIEQSKRCGCYCCTKIFPASKVTEYVSKEEPTAICPYCGTDSVIGDASGIPLSNSLLKSMRMSWFGIP